MDRRAKFIMASTPNAESTNNREKDREIVSLADLVSAVDDWEAEEKVIQKVDSALSESENQRNTSDEPINDTGTERTPTISQAALEKQGENSIQPGFMPRANLVGRTGYLILLVLLAITILSVLRYSNFLPFISVSNSVSQPTTSSNSNEYYRDFVLITTYNNKLYLFDKKNESILEVGFDSNGLPTNPLRKGMADLIPSVDMIIPSSALEGMDKATQSSGEQKTKLAIIANRDEYRHGIYVLDFAKLDKPDFITMWTRDLPAGFSIKQHLAASWSPDGNSLAFVASKEGQPDLFIAKEGIKIQRVTYQGKKIGTIHWIDAYHLAYVSDWEGKDQMYVIGASGGDLQKIPR